MLKYKVLSTSEFEYNNYSLTPIRFEDRFKIMDWRNGQIEFLRQAKPLTECDQEYYFANTVSSLYKAEKPDQLLFSFLEDHELIGYGGLVHIDWQNRHAEISFLLNSAFNFEKSYIKLFSIYLKLIERMAIDLKLNKIFTYGYDLVSYRFVPLVEQAYHLDAKLVKHKTINSKRCDVLIYSKLL